MAYILNDPTIFGIEPLNSSDVYYLSVTHVAFSNKFLPVRWATSKGLANKYFTHTAAQFGNLEALKYLHGKGVPWNVWTCREAAANSHLDCLIYTHENGCPWNIWTCNAAATNGHPPASCRLIV